MITELLGFNENVSKTKCYIEHTEICEKCAKMFPKQRKSAQILLKSAGNVKLRVVKGGQDHISRKINIWVLSQFTGNKIDISHFPQKMALGSLRYRRFRGDGDVTTHFTW